MQPVERPFRPEGAGGPAEHCVLYRFFLFAWLFADLGKAADPFEYAAAWRHNRRMGRFLPVYLRRWGCLAATAFLTGWLCESSLAAAWVVAVWFVGFSVSVAVMTVIVVAWIFTTGIESWRSG